MDWAVKNLNLQIQAVHCVGTDGIADVFGQKLDPSVVRCKRIWPGETQGFFVCKLKMKVDSP
jgi:hypothetical protein